MGDALRERSLRKRTTWSTWLGTRCTSRCWATDDVLVLVGGSEAGGVPQPAWTMTSVGLQVQPAKKLSGVAQSSKKRSLGTLTQGSTNRFSEADIGKAEKAHP